MEAPRKACSGEGERSRKASRGNCKCQAASLCSRGGGDCCDSDDGHEKTDTTKEELMTAEPSSIVGRTVRSHEVVSDCLEGDPSCIRESNESVDGSSQGFELREDSAFWKDHNVQVIIRIRPLNSSEISLQGQNRCVRQDSCQTLTWIGHPESRFTFDLIADEHVSQERLFKVAGVPMVENCMAGYNSCIFAYGQTGSGKTHTMLGDIEEGMHTNGVNSEITPRVFGYLFSRIQKEKENQSYKKLHFTCRCSFLEIYNEQILDLLDPSSINLQIREDAKRGVHVENLKEYEVSSPRDVIQQLIQASYSYWQKSSGAEGERLKEATNINKSLSTLGLVILYLSSSSTKRPVHVPYRPQADISFAETFSTLKFAQRSKFIRNNAIINEESSGDALTMQLQIQQLKKEVNRLRGLINGGVESLGSDGMIASEQGSPALLKWTGEQAKFSPLTFEKRLSPRKEYEAALVAALRRIHDKEDELKALAAERVAADQLVIHRTEEVRNLKLRLRFREDAIKRLGALASEKLLPEAHILQEKEELLKEVEVLRNQIERNPEVTRFAMENMQLREELRRLKSFVEDGEREKMNEQISILQDKLLEALDWKLMHEKTSQAIQNHREVEALRKSLTDSLEAKEKLERRVDELTSQLEEQKEAGYQNMPAVSDDQMELKEMVDAIAVASQREAEAHETAITLARENDFMEKQRKKQQHDYLEDEKGQDMEHQLNEMLEENEKLMALYEKTMERDDFKRMLAAYELPQK
ncbi:hypothetical protein HPP92_018836 [Vanilla planifolia]|uniref:Kinesin motor domain-containing protein n=1 Tax=Vanilla planifolia TaxID=51239 RepID=A0A835Q6F9_VANPL|nr:hypothetical protein HPP92_018836 [Vanilla planifolia]